MRILVADPLAPEGLELLRRHAHVDVGVAPGTLRDRIGEYDALVVRSETRVGRAEVAAGRRLRVIGRAGVGVDNIDVEAATERGIVVVNTPGANTIAAAEHTIGLLLAAARNIPAAAASLRRGEWQRSRYVGVELRGKTLGLIGLGRIGVEVARRVQAFEVDVVAHDPFVGVEIARRMGIELLPLPELLAISDFVSLHLPLNEQTRGIIGAAELALMKPSAILVNCARGGLVDEAALLAALCEGRLAGAALDVFAEEPPRHNPLLEHPRVVATPHLGASTREAQIGVSVEVAEQVVAVLEGRPAAHAVNAPPLPPEALHLLQPFLTLGDLLGRLVGQLTEGQWQSIEIGYRGEISEHDTSAIKAACLQGLLAPVSDEPVNLINAPHLARRRGIAVVERKGGEQIPYTNLLTLALRTDRGQRMVGGTVYDGEPHVVRLDGYPLDLALHGGHILVTHHLDRPGVIGKVGTLLGQADINISWMQVGRQQPRGEALMVLGVDEPIPPDVLQRVKEVTGIDDVRVVRL